MSTGRGSSGGERVVVLGANGVMGAGAAELFAAGGYHVVMLARDRAKAEDALVEVQRFGARRGDR